MRVRIPDLVLALAAVAGGILAWNSGRERSRLKAEARRLALATGDLRVVDPTKAHFLALQTGDPLHFAWRVYLPPGYSFSYRAGLVGGGSMGGGASSSTVARDFIARVRVGEDEPGALGCYLSFYGSGGYMGFGDESLARFLRGRSGEVVAEVLGSGEVATVGPGETATLLRLSMPEGMRAEALRELSPHAKSYVPTLLEVGIGPDALKPPAPARGP